MLDLSSPTRDQTHAPCIRSTVLIPELPGKSWGFLTDNVSGQKKHWLCLNTLLEDVKGWNKGEVCGWAQGPGQCGGAWTFSCLPGILAANQSPEPRKCSLALVQVIMPLCVWLFVHGKSPVLLVCPFYPIKRVPLVDNTKILDVFIALKRCFPSELSSSLAKLSRSCTLEKLPWARLDLAAPCFPWAPSVLCSFLHQASPCNAISCWHISSSTRPGGSGINGHRLCWSGIISHCKT